MNEGERIAPLKLYLRVSGNVPNLKNSKRAILDRNTGKMRTMTDARTQKRMKEIIQSFVCQLNSGSAIIEDEIWTGAYPPFLTAWLKRLKGLDDSRQWIPEIHVYAHDVDKGCEGAKILIEEITNDRTHAQPTP